MKKGIVYIGRLNNRRFSPRNQRYAMIEPYGGLFRRGSESDERECMLLLLKELDIAKVILDSNIWIRGKEFVEGEGWLANGENGWVLHPPECNGYLSRLMMKAQCDEESIILKIFTTKMDVIQAIVNENNEFWYLLGSFESLNDAWLRKCMKNMPDWKFKGRGLKKRF